MASIKKPLKYTCKDIYGEEIELKIFSFDRNVVKISIGESDATLKYEDFAEFTNKCNQFIRDKRFKD